MKPLFLLLNCFVFSLFSMNSIASEIEQEEYIPPISSEDPYEDFNRSMFDFNVKFINSVGEPVASAYLDYTPQPVQTGLENFFTNLKMPLNMINNFLQGNIQKGLEDTMRFTINSTFGLFGLLDIATPAGLKYEKEDFGQTLYVWGVWDQSEYIVLPFLGPYTFREGIGSGFEVVYDPAYNQIIDADDLTKNGLLLTDRFISFTQYVELMDTMMDQPDPYIFMRESYIQYRTTLLLDGNVPQPELDDFDFE